MDSQPPYEPPAFLLAIFPAVYADVVGIGPSEHGRSVSRKGQEVFRFVRCGRIGFGSPLIGFAAGADGICGPDLELVGPVIGKACDRVAPGGGAASRHFYPGKKGRGFVGGRWDRLVSVLPQGNRRVGRSGPLQAHLRIAVFRLEAGRLCRNRLRAGRIRQRDGSAKTSERLPVTCGEFPISRPTGFGLAGAHLRTTMQCRPARMTIGAPHASRS